jgi:LPXTG-site transpeptidase (sortase) family protein
MEVLFLYLGGSQMKAIKKLIVILLILLVGIRLYLFYVDRSNEKAREEAEQIFQDMILNTESESASGQVIVTDTKGNETLTKGDPNVIGKIEIDKLDLSYVILNGAKKEQLDISIGKVTGPEVHEQGNLVLAGHNMRDGSLFGKLKQLKLKDTFRVIDANGISKEYIIYEIDIVKDTDLSPLKQDISTTPVTTLITCTDDGKLRVIYYAKQIG